MKYTRKIGEIEQIYEGTPSEINETVNMIEVERLNEEKCCATDVKLKACEPKTITINSKTTMLIETLTTNGFNPNENFIARINLKNRTITFGQ